MSTAVLYPETALGRKSRGYATRSVASVDSRAQRFLSNSDVCGGFRTRVTAGSGISALTVELTSLVTLWLPLSPLPLMGPIVLSVLWPSGLLAFVLVCRFVLVGSPALVVCTQI